MHLKQVSIHCESSSREMKRRYELIISFFADHKMHMSRSVRMSPQSSQQVATGPSTGTG